MLQQQQQRRRQQKKFLVNQKKNNFTNTKTTANLYQKSINVTRQQPKTKHSK